MALHTSYIPLYLCHAIRGCRPVASLVPPAQFNWILSLTGFRRKLASVLARPYHLSLLLPAILVKHYFSSVYMQTCIPYSSTLY
jgi:hypothetical protein